MEVLPDETQVIYTYDRSESIVYKVTIIDEQIKESIKYDVSGKIKKILDC